jgi:hypothetical protein
MQTNMQIINQEGYFSTMKQQSENKNKATTIYQEITSIIPQLANAAGFYIPLFVAVFPELAVAFFAMTFILIEELTVFIIDMIEERVWTIIERFWENAWIKFASFKFARKLIEIETIHHHFCKRVPLEKDCEVIKNREKAPSSSPAPTAAHATSQHQHHSKPLPSMAKPSTTATFCWDPWHEPLPSRSRKDFSKPKLKPTLYFDQDPVWRAKEAGRYPPTKNRSHTTKSTNAITTPTTTKNVISQTKPHIAVEPTKVDDQPPLLDSTNVVSCPMVDELCHSLTKFKISTKTHIPSRSAAPLGNNAGTTSTEKLHEPTKVGDWPGTRKVYRRRPVDPTYSPVRVLGQKRGLSDHPPLDRTIAPAEKRVRLLLPKKLYKRRPVAVAVACQSTPTTTPPTTTPISGLRIKRCQQTTEHMPGVTPRMKAWRVM